MSEVIGIAPGSEVSRAGVRRRVTAVVNPASLGVSRYAARLAAALADEQVDYRLDRRVPRVTDAHFHLANSSRRYLRTGNGRMSRQVVTVHDVLPRTRALHPVYRLLVYPRLGKTAVVVHSAYAADLLVAELGRRPPILEVVPHPASAFGDLDRQSARRALGWPEESLIAVIPGVIKQAKLVREALAAVAKMPGWRLALAGRLVDAPARNAAYGARALLLSEPDDAAYARALAASDCVLCLRRDSVGETNGPLLDALGAGRAVLATATGSIPEVAGEAAEYCDGTEHGIELALARLADADLRAELERASAARAATLTWARSAARHAELFGEVFDG